MSAVVRIGLIRDLSPQQVAAGEHNVLARVIPTVQGQLGFLLGIWASTVPAGGGLSFTVMTDAERAVAAGVAVNSAPLLPGQLAEAIAGPRVVITGELHFATPPIGTAQAAHVIILQATSTAETSENWASEAFGPFLASLPGVAGVQLTHAAPDVWVVLTLWSTPESLESAVPAIDGWLASPPLGAIPHLAVVETTIYARLLAVVSGS
jgi:hypothetical protein